MGGALEELIGATVLDGKKQNVAVATVSGSGKVVGLYFSAHWCPPCRGFTPKLAEFYKKMKDRLEIVFVSSDNDEQQWAEYFGEMPWLALPFADCSARDAALSEKYGIEGIPTLVLLDGKTGETIQADARSKVEEHPNGDGFPWKG